MLKYLTFYARETLKKKTATTKRAINLRLALSLSLLDLLAVGFYNIIVMLHYYIIIYSVLSLRFVLSFLHIILNAHNTKKKKHRKRRRP